MIIFNEEPGDIIKTNHICYYISETGSSYKNIQLMEIVEKYIRHPQAKEYANIATLDIQYVKTFNRFEPNGSASVLLEAAQNNQKNIIKILKEKGEIK